MNKITAIYVILNCVNGKAYLGSTFNFKERKSKHVSVLRGEYHINKHLQNAFNKYGEDNFEIFPIEEFTQISSKALLKKEAWYIREHDLINPKFGYNIQKDPIDMSGENHPMFGKKHSNGTKEKLRLAKLGKKNPMYGKPGVNLGKKFSLETREKLCGPRPNTQGKNSFHWKGGLLIINCDYCGNGFKRPQWHINRNKKLGRNYCSRECWYKALGKILV